MSARVITKEHVKKWVVNHSSITNPHKKEWWYCGVTLGYDYAEKGKTIEQAYNAMVDFIFKSPFVMCKLSDCESFRKIVKEPNP